MSLVMPSSGQFQNSPSAQAFDNAMGMSVSLQVLEKGLLSMEQFGCVVQMSFAL